MLLLPLPNNEDSLHPAKGTAKGRRLAEEENVLALCGCFICKIVFSLKLRLLCNFSKGILEQLSVMKQLSDNSGSGHKTMRAIHKYILFVSVSTESAVSMQRFSPCCAFNLNLT